MCGVAEASLAVSAIGTAVGAYGQYQQGQNARRQGEYQAAVARNNAILAERAAEDARKRGAEAEREHGLQVKQLIGRQRAVLASNGVVVDQGSALDITSDTAETGKYEQLVIRSNAEREALGYRTQGMNFEADAGLSLAAGRNAASAATLGAAGTLLTGAGSVAGKWYNYKKQGLIV